MEITIEHLKELGEYVEAHKVEASNNIEHGYNLGLSVAVKEIENFKREAERRLKKS